MRETLVLIPVNGVWHADFNETSEAGRIRQLFGGTLVPLPFTTEADLQKRVGITSRPVTRSTKVWAVGPREINFLTSCQLS